jgi:hypothetical protein
MADGLDHFDGDQFVKFSAQTAVVIPLSKLKYGLVLADRWL